MKKKKEETCQITPKGLISIAISYNQDIWDALELYCYRNGYNALLVNSDGGQFIKVEIEK